MSREFPAPGDLFAEKYLIQKKVGQGGFAQVMLATQLGLKRRVAIKMFAPKKVVSDGEDSTGSDSNGESFEAIAGRFEREARLVSQLQSPHTITVHDFGRTDDGVLYMVMEFVAGACFDELDAPLEPERAVGIMRQILLSLKEAHKYGVLHRDLKPANMMLFDHAAAKDQVKLLDFGVAKVLRSQKRRKKRFEDVTEGDVVIGTPRYMSPEQIIGVDMDGRSDIYSFGLVAYELLTGQPVIEHGDDLTVLKKHIDAEPFGFPEDSEVPEQLREIVEKMIEKDPDRRFDDAESVIDALADYEFDAVSDRASADISTVIKRRAADITAEFKRDAEEVSRIAGEDGWFEALRSKHARRPLSLLVVFMLVLGTSIVFIVSGGDEARAGAVQEAEPVQRGNSELALRAFTSTVTAIAAQPAMPAAPAPVPLEDDNVENALELRPISESARVMTEPAGAEIYIGDELIGEAPVDIDADSHQFPLKIRAEKGDSVGSVILDEPGGKITVELREPPKPKPAPRRKPAPRKEKNYHFEPLD